MVDLLRLPFRQLSLLVAHAACWSVCDRAPSPHELRRVGCGFALSSPHYAALFAKGLLVSQRRGKHRVIASVKPSAEAWAQLAEIGVVVAERLEVAS